VEQVSDESEGPQVEQVRGLSVAVDRYLHLVEHFDLIALF
jgi:hypothetical protein